MAIYYLPTTQSMLIHVYVAHVYAAYFHETYVYVAYVCVRACVCNVDMSQMDHKCRSNVSYIYLVWTTAGFHDSLVPYALGTIIICLP